MFSSGLVMSGTILLGMTTGVVLAILLGIGDARLPLTASLISGVFGIYFGLHTGLRYFNEELTQTYLIGMNTSTIEPVAGAFIVFSALALGLITGTQFS